MSSPYYRSPINAPRRVLVAYRHAYFYMRVECQGVKVRTMKTFHFFFSVCKPLERIMPVYRYDNSIFVRLSPSFGKSFRHTRWGIVRSPPSLYSVASQQSPSFSPFSAKTCTLQPSDVYSSTAVLTDSHCPRDLEVVVRKSTNTSH